MGEIIRVCAWCSREIDRNGQPGRIVPDHNDRQLNPDIGHGCCRECQLTVDSEVAAFKFDEKVERQKEQVLCRS